jgi:hypothetical protein
MTSAKSADSHDMTTNGTSSTTSTSPSAKDQARDVAASVRGAAETVASRLPEAATQTRAAVDEAARRIETGSDEMLTAGTSLSLGLAIGMLVGGAPRILVALALVPAAAMGLTILDRNSRATGRRSI